MPINVNQLRDYIILPTLRNIGLNSDGAINLMLGIAAQESHLGEFIKQINGPALGIYQMEPNTYHYIWDTQVAPKINVLAKIKIYCGYSGKPDSSRLMNDLVLSTIMTRLFFIPIKELLPASNDITGLANYWKKYYNTIKGKGTIEDFIYNYRKYVLNDKNN